MDPLLIFRSRILELWIVDRGSSQNQVCGIASSHKSDHSNADYDWPIPLVNAAYDDTGEDPNTRSGASLENLVSYRLHILSFYKSSLQVVALSQSTSVLTVAVPPTVLVDRTTSYESVFIDPGLAEDTGHHRIRACELLQLILQAGGYTLRMRQVPHHPKLSFYRIP